LFILRQSKAGDEDKFDHGDLALSGSGRKDGRRFCIDG